MCNVGQWQFGRTCIFFPRIPRHSFSDSFTNMRPAVHIHDDRNITEPLITAHDTAVSSLQCNSSLTARHARFRLKFPELRSNFANMYDSFRAMHSKYSRRRRMPKEHHLKPLSQLLSPLVFVSDVSHEFNGHRAESDLTACINF